MTDYIEKINSNTIGGRNFDSTWNDGATISSSFTLTGASATTTFDLSSILPRDDYIYECIFEGVVETATGSGSRADMELSAGSTTGVEFTVAHVITRTSGNEWGSGIATLQINPEDRAVTVSSGSSTGTVTYGLYLKRIKRIGKNPYTALDCVEKISIPSQSDISIGGNIIAGAPTALNSLTTGTTGSIITLYSGSLTANSLHEADVSSYLPDDGCPYEVKVTLMGQTDSTSGHWIALRAGTENMTTLNINQQVAGVTNRSGASKKTGGNAIVPVGTDRKIVFGNTGGNTASNCAFVMTAYRRLGTNTLNGTYIEDISVPSSSQLPCAFNYGGVTISDGVASGFSSTKYLELTRNAYTNSEYVICFTTPSSFSGTQNIFSIEDFLDIYLTSGGGIQSWNKGAETGNTIISSVSTNTNYWVKVQISGNDGASSRTYSYSNTNGISWTSAGTFTDTGATLNTGFLPTIGNHSRPTLRSSRAFNGSINLKNCYIKVDNNVVWRGMDYKKLIPFGGTIESSPIVLSVVQVFSSTLTATGSSTFDVTGYLPDNLYDYEVFFNGYSETGKKSGAACEWYISASGQGKSMGGCVTSRNARGVINSRNGSLYIPKSSISIKKDETLFTLRRQTADIGSTTTQTCTMYLIGYRRLGTNE